MSETEIYGTGIPCTHPGCINHITHPCEKCGRIKAQGIYEKIIHRIETNVKNK